MKKALITFFALSAASLASAQVTILFESFGDPGDSEFAISEYLGYDNVAVAFSGTGDVRSSRVSAGYAMASGGGNVFINATAEFFQIDNIDTSAYSDISLQFGSYEAIGGQDGVDSGVLMVEYSINGSDWTELSYSGPGANGWGIAAAATGALPSSSNLGLRFTNVDPNDKEIRVDDIILEGVGGLVGVPEPSALGLLVGLAAMAGMVRRR